MQRAERRAHAKLTDPQALLDLFDLDAALPFAPHLRLDTSQIGPTDMARTIVAYFALPLAPLASGGAGQEW